MAGELAGDIGELETTVDLDDHEIGTVLAKLPNRRGDDFGLERGSTAKTVPIS